MHIIPPSRFFPRLLLKGKILHSGTGGPDIKSSRSSVCRRPCMENKTQHTHPTNPISPVTCSRSLANLTGHAPPALLLGSKAHGTARCKRSLCKCPKSCQAPLVGAWVGGAGRPHSAPRRPFITVQHGMAGTTAPCPPVLASAVLRLPPPPA